MIIVIGTMPFLYWCSALYTFNMRLLKTHPILGLVNSYVVDSPQPANLSYMWNFGSLLGMVLGIQIITGVTLAMHYTPSVDYAFSSVEHIMRDVNYGWLIRYMHANGASFFFIFVYLHIGRGLYYGSYRSPRTLLWSIGVIMLIVMIVTAFLGYVLPYGQMSLWGATVITNLMSAVPWIGQDIVETLLTTCETLLIASIPVIGTINWKVIRAGRKAPYSEHEIKNFLQIPYNVVARFVGLADAEGVISVNHTGTGFVRIFLKITVHVRDASLLQSVRASLLNIGNIHAVDAAGKVSWVIPKTDLQEILFPLMIYHNIYFLVEVRRQQFNKAMYVLENHITKWSDVANTSLPISQYLPDLPTTALGLASLPFFNPWLVGLVIGDGSFFVKSNKDACFQITQRENLLLLQAVALQLNTSRKIGNSGAVGQYNLLSVSSKEDIQRVIDFFEVTCPMLTGHKLDQYRAWIAELKASVRYSKLNFHD